MSPLCGEVGEKGGTPREKEESPLFSKPSSLIITVAKKKKQQKLNPGLCSPPSSESSAPPRPRTSST